MASLNKCFNSLDISEGVQKRIRQLVQDYKDAGHKAPIDAAVAEAIETAEAERTAVAAFIEEQGGVAPEYGKKLLELMKQKTPAELAAERKAKGEAEAAAKAETDRKKAEEEQKKREEEAAREMEAARRRDERERKAQEAKEKAREIQQVTQGDTKLYFGADYNVNLRKVANGLVSALGKHLKGASIFFMTPVTFRSWLDMSPAERQKLDPELNRLLELHKEYFKDAINKDGLFGSMAPGFSDKAFIVFTKFATTDGANTQVLAHEIGHVVHHHHYMKLSESNRKALYNAWVDHWNNMNDSIPHLNYKEWVGLTRGFFRTRDYLEIGAEYRSPHDLTRRSQKYLMSFNEFFADQVAKWATTDEKPLTVLEQFYKDVADALRTIISHLTGTRAKYLPTEVFRAYLNGDNFVDVSRIGSSVPLWYENDVPDGLAPSIQADFTDLEAELASMGYGVSNPEYVPEEVAVVDPAKTKGRVTLLSNDKDIYKQVALFKNFLSAFGMNSFKITMAEAGDLVANSGERLAQSSDFVYSKLSGYIKRGIFQRAIAGTDFDPTTGEAFLMINKEKFLKLPIKAQYQVIAHEAGHILERVFFHSATKEQKNAILDAWRNHIKTTLPKTITRGDMLRQLRASEVGREALNKLSPETQNKLALEQGNAKTENDTAYIAGFSEWFADQTAKWASTTEAPKSPMEKFFKGLYDRFKYLVAKLNRTADTWYDLPDATVAEFLNERIQMAKDAKEWNFDYAPEMYNVIDEFSHQGFEMQTEVETWDMLYDKPPPWSAVHMDIQEMREMSEEELADQARKAAGGFYTETEEQRRSNYSRLTKPREALNGWVKRQTSELTKGFTKAFASGSDRIERISLPIMRQINKWVKGVNEQNAKYKRLIQPFMKLYRSLSAEERMEFDHYLLNGSKVHIDKFLRGKDDLRREYEVVNGMLKDIKARADKLGIEFAGQDLETYWPRVLNDREGLLKLMEGTQDYTLLDDTIKEAKSKATSLGMEWTPELEEEVINSFLHTGRYFGSLGTAGSTKERAIDQVTSSMLPFYKAAGESLLDHIYEMNEFIGREEFLSNGKHRKKLVAELKTQARLRDSKMGNAESRANAAKRYVEIFQKLTDHSREDSAMSESLTSMVAQMRRSQGLTGEQAETILNIVRSRMMERGLHGVAAKIRNVGLVTTLTDFTSLITQASEILLNIYENGPTNSVAGLMMRLRGQGVLSAEDFDLKNQMLEYQSASSSKMVGVMLKYSGFQWTDIVMKEAFLNASILKARKQVNKGGFQEKWQPYFGDDFAALQEEIASGTVGPLQTEMAWAQLMRYQPLDVIANPEAYMTGGNARIFYMLKTFQMRQANAIYREGIAGLRSEDKRIARQSAMRLVALSSLVVLGGATKDEVRDFWLGRQVPMREHIWDNLLNVVLFSRYDSFSIASEGLGRTILGKALPPTPVLDLPARDISKWMKGEPSAQFLKMVPILGKVTYDRFTDAGQKTQANNRKKYFGQRIKTAVQDGDRGALQTIRTEIREYNQSVPKELRMTTSAISRKISEARKELRN